MHCGFFISVFWVKTEGSNLWTKQYRSTWVFFYIPSRHDFALRKRSLSLVCTVYMYNTYAYIQTSGPSEQFADGR